MAPRTFKNSRTCHPRPRSRAQKRVHEDTAIHARMERFQRIGISIGRHVQFTPAVEKAEKAEKVEKVEKVEVEKGKGEESEDDSDDDVRIVDFAERERVNMHTYVIDALIAVVQRTHLDMRSMGAASQM
jgi:hypothetical protein